MLYVFNFQIGPGIVYLEFESFFGKGVFIQSLTPAEPMVQKLVHNLYMHWAVPNIVTKFFMYGEAIQVICFNANLSVKGMPTGFIISNVTMNSRKKRLNVQTQTWLFMCVYITRTWPDRQGH